MTWTGLKPVREKSSRIIRVRLRASSYEEEEERRMTGGTRRREASANLLLAGFLTAVSFDGMSRSIRKVSSLTSNDTYGGGRVSGKYENYKSARETFLFTVIFIRTNERTNVSRTLNVSTSRRKNAFFRARRLTLSHFILTEFLILRLISLQFLTSL